MSDVIKIFGLPRSCTNVTEVLLVKNFKVRVLTNFPCWKHGHNTYKSRKLNDKEKRAVTDHLEYVVCTKNPYLWLVSILDFENDHLADQKKHRDLLDYITGNTCYHYPDNNPIAMFNELNAHWLSIAKDVFRVDAEQLSSERVQLQMLQIVQKKFDLQLKLEQLEPQASRVGPSIKIEKQKFKKRDYLSRYTPKMLREVASRLDSKLMKQMGYKVL